MCGTTLWRAFQGMQLEQRLDSGSPGTDRSPDQEKPDQGKPDRGKPPIAAAPKTDHIGTMPDQDIVPHEPARYAADQATVAAGFRDKLRDAAGRIPFVEDALAAYYCALDRGTPVQVKAVLMGALAYFVLPSDMIPDFILGLGFTDDAAVLYAAIRTVAPNIRAHHRTRARAALRRTDETAG